MSSIAFSFSSRYCLVTCGSRRKPTVPQYMITGKKAAELSDVATNLKGNSFEFAFQERKFALVKRLCISSVEPCCGETTMNQLQKFQNRAARILLKQFQWP